MHCGPSLSKEPKSLKTLQLKEPETLLSVWFKQPQTANSSTDEPHLKEKALHVAASRGIDGFQALNGGINHFKKIHNPHCFRNIEKLRTKYTAIPIHR